MSLYNIAQPVGAMLSGAMQGALSTNLEGSLGRSGWRWAFIINVSLFITRQILTCEPCSDKSGYLHDLCRLGRFYTFTWLCKYATSDSIMMFADARYLARTTEPTFQILPQA
jgi:MFS family permease